MDDSLLIFIAVMIIACTVCKGFIDSKLKALRKEVFELNSEEQKTANHQKQAEAALGVITTRERELQHDYKQLMNEQAELQVQLQEMEDPS